MNIVNDKVQGNIWGVFWRILYDIISLVEGKDSG